MGAYNTEHKNNKIMQEHWSDLISAVAVDVRMSTHVHTFACCESCTCACIRHDDCEDHSYKWDMLLSPLRF